MAKIITIGVRQLSVYLRLSPFENTYGELTKLLDSIKVASGKGKSIGNGMTDEGTKAYGDAAKKAREVIEKVAKDLKPEDVTALSGLGFRQLPLPPPPAGFPPPKPKTQDQLNRDDIVSSPLFAWDKSAAAYLSNKHAEGDTLKTELLKRLREFDASIRGRGNPPVKPDA